MTHSIVDTIRLLGISRREIIEGNFMFTNRRFISEDRFNKKYLDDGCKKKYGYRRHRFCMYCTSVDVGVQEVKVKDILALSRDEKELQKTGRLPSAYQAIKNGWSKQKCEEINLLLTPSGKLCVQTDGNHRIYLAKKKLHFEKVWATITVEIPCKFLNETDLKIIEKLTNEKQFIRAEMQKIREIRDSYCVISKEFSHHNDNFCKWGKYQGERSLRERNYLKSIVEREKLVPDNWIIEPLEEEKEDEVDVIMLSR